jgi:tRNA (cytosine38-C5)-methyltransferase
MSEGRIRCLEFFSGIGGMHFALKAASLSSKIDFQVVEAFDINTNANQTYTHNFPSIKPKAANVEHLPLSRYEEYAADFWLLSPPCQPFTRGGKGLDDKDARSSGLLFLIETLKQMEKKPKYLFLENVLNFERSQCRDKLVAVLREYGYRVKEYLVSPLEIGIPNNRLRYYLSAIRIQEQPFECEDVEEIIRTLSQCASAEVVELNDVFYSNENRKQSESDQQIRRLESHQEIKQHHSEQSIKQLGSNESQIAAKRHCPSEEISLKSSLSLERYLDKNIDESFLVPQEYLLRCKNFTFDIVCPLDCYSSTFTKAYGSHQIVGTGSLVSSYPLKDKSDQQAVLEAKPRFFTPNEIAKLHDFPPSFSFPSSITTKQKYKLLGNSLNVKVVALIIGEMFIE